MRVLFLNPQGNFDSKDSYWTEHPDFGGQLVYVKEIASEISKLGHKVDIVTRYIDDEKFSAFKGQFDTYEGFENLRIVRIKCGGDQFLNKELLWEHLEEWVDNIIAFYDKEEIAIDFATGHYGDGGLAAAMLKDKKGIPYSFTGHSLGAQKFDKLKGSLENLEALDNKYHFTKRIQAENTAIKYSDIIFVSTEQERDEQYQHPLYKASSMDKHFAVAPPGANTTVFEKYNGRNVSDKVIKKIDTVLARDIDEERLDLGYVISASRLDPKKNHVGLLEAFAKSKALQEKANVMISLRGIPNAFESYENVKPAEKEILDELMKIIKDNDLIGKVSFVSIESQSELADTYRYMTTKSGIFTLTALYEPFGLAPIEAMSTGLPAVVTKYGGPSDVLKESDEIYGVLIDVKDLDDISNGLLEAFSRYDFYQKQGILRVFSKYTWAQTAKKYLDEMNLVIDPSKDAKIPKYFYTKKKPDLNKKYIIDKYLK
jgi:sucrose-phosphate synthase